MLDSPRFLAAWPYGYAQVRETEDFGAVSKYCMKYLLKDCTDDNYNFWPLYYLGGDMLPPQRLNDVFDVQADGALQQKIAD